MSTIPKSTQLGQSGPSFRHPPVVETALGIQFSELSRFTAAHFGLYFEQIKARYPIPQDKPRLDRIIEPFPLVRSFPSLRVERFGGGPGRMWYLDCEDGARLIQLQPDRFGFNWRRANESDQYPRFAQNGPICLEEFQQFCDFCVEHDLGDVRPDLCEVVYVNHIQPDQGESAIQCFGNVFAGIDWRSSDDWLPEPESAMLNRTFRIEENHGRLFAEASIASGADKREFVLLKLTARVKHVEGFEIGDSLQLAHDWVVKGFASLTSEGARRQRWEQYE